MGNSTECAQVKSAIFSWTPVNAPDLAMANGLAGKKVLPIKQLLQRS
jgi:hypothetical protein